MAQEDIEDYDWQQTIFDNFYLDNTVDFFHDSVDGETSLVYRIEEIGTVFENIYVSSYGYDHHYYDY